MFCSVFAQVVSIDWNLVPEYNFKKSALVVRTIRATLKDSTDDIYALLEFDDETVYTEAIERGIDDGKGSTETP